MDLLAEVGNLNPPCGFITATKTASKVKFIMIDDDSGVVEREVTFTVEDDGVLAQQKRLKFTPSDPSPVADVGTAQCFLDGAANMVLCSGLCEGDFSE